MNCHNRLSELDIAKARIEELETALAVCRQELADARAVLFCAPVLLPDGIVLARRQGDICRVLLRNSPRFVQKPRLFSAIYTLEEQGLFKEETIESHVSLLRNALEKHDLHIICRRFLGYAMPAESARRLRAMIEAESRAA